MVTRHIASCLTKITTNSVSHERSSPNLTHEKEKVEDKCFSDAKAVVSAPKEHRKQENALWNILFTKLFTMSFSGFWMRTLNYLV